jgi:MFS family permease
MRPRFTGLWRHYDFTKLWAGQTVSVFGSMMTRIALPLTALLTLDSSPLQQGFLQAVEAGPVLAAGLFAGVWVDRLRRRPVMIAADLARAVVLLSIPIAAFAGVLTMVQLYAVAAAAALFTTFFDAAYQAYLPTLVGRERLVEGNARLTASASVAEMGGFAAAGVLVQFLTGPLALLIDAATFVASALSLAWIRTPETPIPPVRQRRVMAEVGEGLVVLWEDKTLRALVGCSTVISAAGGAFGAMYMIFAVRDLGLSPAAAGAIAACGGIGSLVGATLAEPALRRLGPKITIALGFGLGGAFQMFVPLAHGPAFVAGAYLVVAQVIGDGLMTTAFVNDVSLRQALVPDRLLGRVSSTANVLRVTAMPIGAIAGGFLGQLAGPRSALAAAAIGFSVASLWIWVTPIRLPGPRDLNQPSLVGAE